MQQFIAYLGELNHTAPAVLKLYNLCVTFGSLASFALLNAVEDNELPLEEQNNTMSVATPPFDAKIQTSLPVHSIDNSSPHPPQQSNRIETVFLFEGHGPQPPYRGTNRPPDQQHRTHDESSLTYLSPNLNQSNFPSAHHKTENIDLFNEEFLRQFMDSEPQLQWLDWDLSAMDKGH